MKKIFYSKLYKKYYPFKNTEDVLSLNEKEKAKLFTHITSLPQLIYAIVLDHNISSDKTGGGHYFTLDSDIFEKWKKECSELAKNLYYKSKFSLTEIEKFNFVLRIYKYNFITHSLIPAYMSVERVNKEISQLVEAIKNIEELSAASIETEVSEYSWRRLYYANKNHNK